MLVKVCKDEDSGFAESEGACKHYRSTLLTDSSATGAIFWVVRGHTSGP